MKQWNRIASLSLVLLLLVLQLGPVCLAANDPITTTPTGYARAEDVEYVIVSGTVVNWGARGETCTFLTTYAENYYTDTYSWDALSQKDGGTGTSDAPSSALFQALQAIMQAKHTKLQGYQDTRPYYQYTDCVGNDYSLISSFYSGKTVAGKWTGSTYNREHIWPKSKCLFNNKTNDSADIMMLRATISSENSTRGNSAYGEGGGYFDPGASVRGDCARMVLYGYVRWGNTGKMWGSSGVIENLDILLKWMAEDPVDTWEMGRNDSVQSITGVRNVFVDYPEFAWLLFGEEIPADLVTPSGSKTDAPCTHESTEIRNETAPACSADGYTGDSYCTVCGELVSYGEVIPATGQHNLSEWITAPGGGSESRWCSDCDYEETRELPDCPHANTEFTGEKAPTCTEDGHTGNTLCKDCGCFTVVGEPIPATGHLNREIRNQKPATATEEGYTGDTYCTDCGEKLASGSSIPATEAPCSHPYFVSRNEQPASCLDGGYSGDIVCGNCNTVLEHGSETPPRGHDFGDWASTEDGASRTCKACGHQEHQNTTKPKPIWPVVICCAVVTILVGGGVCAVVIIKKKKK